MQGAFVDVLGAFEIEVVSGVSQGEAQGCGEQQAAP
jgi:hypothetical protein